MLRVYIETTIPSFLTARPSRDIVIAGKQEITRQWWEEERSKHDLYVSELVMDEASGGDEDAARKRIDVLTDIPVLDVTIEAQELAKRLVKLGGLPQKAEQDAIHVGVASVQQMDVLLTWNCTHLANIETLKQIGNIIRETGFEPPFICTPMELMGGD